jgi:DNA-binding NtrC family response regulator
MATEGRQAQRIFLWQHFDVVIADQLMPDIDGITLLESLRKTDTEFKALLISKFPKLLKQETSRIQSIGPVAIIEKPFSFSEIDAAVTRIQQEAIDDSAAVYRKAGAAY